MGQSIQALLEENAKLKEQLAFYTGINLVMSECCNSILVSFPSSNTDMCTKCKVEYPTKTN